jgi:Prp8 binding protein
MTDKRKDPPTSAGSGALTVKRQRQNGDGANRATNALTIGPSGQQRAVIQAVKRTSGLQAPIMQLSGHTVRYL